MNTTLKEKIKKVKLLVLDVDGILTDGQIVLDDRGKEIKVFDVQDGFGIVLFQRAGYQVAILSARSSEAVTRRAKDLKIEYVFQDASPKVDVYNKLLREISLTDAEVCFMGDDLPDIEVLKKVGFAVSVPNAASEVKKCADYITGKNGGHGAVREVVELICKTQKKWSGVLKAYGV